MYIYYDGLARPEIRQSLRRGQRYTYDPEPPVVLVPPPSQYPEKCAVRSTNTQNGGTLRERWDVIFAESLDDDRQTVYDETFPTDLYTDGSCTDNGRPFAAAGWGVHVHNSDELGEYYGALPGQV